MYVPMKRVSHSGPDIISDLPSCITDNILMFLPLSDAVRTSVLSRKWRYKWVTLPKLAFDNLVSLKTPPEELPAKHKLVTTIYKVILRHRGPIVKFLLSNPSLESCSDINHWLLSLSSNELHDFTLRICNGHQQHKLPIHFYSFLQLRHLNLRTCYFNPPPNFQGFCSLLSLDFENISVVSTNVLCNFISNCPLLEHLRLSGPDRFSCLEIDAPNLRSLILLGCFESIRLKNSPLLAMVDIGVCTSEFYEDVGLLQGETSRFIQVLGCTTVLENLSLRYRCLKFLAAGDVIMETFPMTLQHLKILYIGDVCFAVIQEISCTLCIIKSSPNLQKLEILVSASSRFPSTYYMDRVVEYLKEQDLSNCSLNQLRTVKMIRVSGAKPELEFMKLILANAAGLEKIFVIPSKDVKDGGLEMLKELTRFPRTSPKAEIVFGSES